MATRRYEIDPWGTIGTFRHVTEAVGSATASKAVEVTVDLAEVKEKRDVLRALDEIKKHIVKGGWPPA